MSVQRFSVCYHCKNRVIGCHSNCKEYIQEKIDNQRVKKEVAKEQMVSEALSNLHHHRNKNIKDLRHSSL